MSFLSDLGIDIPIIQAPMAGVSTPTLAAEVSNAGGLGSIGIGATTPDKAREMISELHQKTDRAYNVNLFAHKAPRSDTARELAWLDALRSEFGRFGAAPPKGLKTIYKSFSEDDEMLDMLLKTRPPVVSFHFGLPQEDKIAALKQAGCVLLASATNIEEADALVEGGMDAIIAQGFEAGGHRGVFDPNAPDPELGTMALIGALKDRLRLPIIAAGGLMDGNDIAQAMLMGASAAQLGTAFIACPESSADQAYLDTLMSDRAYHTVMSSAISGRPARCLYNRFTEWAAARTELTPPDYPKAYDVGKQLNQAAKLTGEHGYGAQWAGSNAPLARSMPAAQLLRTLADELIVAQTE